MKLGSKTKKWYDDLKKDGCNSKHAVAEDIKLNADTLIETEFNALSINGQRDMLDTLNGYYRRNKAIPVGQQEIVVNKENEFEL